MDTTSSPPPDEAKAALDARVTALRVADCVENDYQRYARMSGEDLAAEYLELQKACFGHNVFSGNARDARALVVHVFWSRGTTEIANIFGPITIRP